ncbi:MAG: carboxypeptidase regulatory-like domain-containing protein, partial [Acidobacteria bacterium]
MLKTNWLLCGLPAALMLLTGCQTESPSSVAIDDDDIGGVVTSTNGPEAGVWVIAETNDLGTMFVRIVVTDDQGRYLVPDLPTANYT